MNNVKNKNAYRKDLKLHIVKDLTLSLTAKVIHDLAFLKE